MFKTAMLVSALAISAPSLAQDMPASQETPPTTQTPPVSTPDPVPPTDPAAAPEAQAPTTAGRVPVDDAAVIPQDIPGAPVTAPAETATAPAEQTPATPAETAAAPTDPATPVTGASQIAAVVDTEFPTYDKNADSNLDKSEFGAWMVALKTASDPATKATDPATVKWVDGAFASADTDKSTAVSKAELTAYLSQGAE